MRGRSFAAPIILIGLGAIFLVNNVRPELSIWRLLGDYWPFLLILFGLIRLGEVLWAASNGTLQTNSIRPMGFGPIVAVIALGILISLPSHWRQDYWHWGPIRAMELQGFGEQFDYPVSQTMAAGGAKRLVLDNLRGNITVNGTDGSAITIEGHKNVQAFDRNAADKVNGQSTVILVPEGDVLYVRASEPTMPDQSRLSVDLEVSVPKALEVEARGRSGDLTINSILGSVDVASQKGEIRLSDIGGSAKLEVERCDLVRASKVRGAIELQGNGRDVQLDEVKGQVTISGRFSGTLEFRDLGQPLHFEGDQTDLKVEKLPGSMTLDLRDLRATNLTGAFHLQAHSRDVHLEDFAGPVDIDMGGGDVDLRPVRGQLSRMDVRSRHGNIDLALPADGNFDLTAATQQGEVSNDYGDGIIADSQGRSARLRSALPKGPAIALNTERGEVAVRKLE